MAPASPAGPPPTKRTSNKTASALGFSFTQKNYNRIVDQYFDQYFTHNPTAATGEGFHGYDARLEDYSKKEVTEQIRILTSFRREFKKVDPGYLNADQVMDVDLAVSNIDA